MGLRDKLAQIGILKISLVLGIVLMSLVMVSAIFYTSSTFLLNQKDNQYTIIQNTPQWNIYGDLSKYDVYITDKNSKKTLTYFCDKEATSKNDLTKSEDFKDKEEKPKDKNKVKVKEFGGKFCYEYTTDGEEDYIHLNPTIIWEAPSYGAVTAYEDHILFNFTENNESFANMDVFVVKGELDNETFNWTKVEGNVLIKISNESYKINVSMLNQTPAYYGFVFNQTYRSRYDGDNNYRFYYSDNQYIEVNNELFCQESDDCWAGQVDGLPAIFGGMFNGSFDPEVYLGADEVYPSAYGVNATSYGMSSVLDVDSATPYDSLVGYWGFDSDNNVTAYDWSGNDNDGTYQGNAYVDSGYLGDGAVLDGNGDYISVANDLSLNVTELSTSGWLYFDSINTYNFIIDRRSASGNYWALSQRSSGKLHFEIYDGSFYTWITDDVVFETDKWIHYTVIHDGSDVTMYIDGENVDVTNGGGSKALPSLTNPLLIGAYNGGLLPFNGSIDEVMVFNSTLTAQQVSDIYSNQSARFVDTGNITISQQNITSGYNRVNLTTSFDSLLGSSVDARVGYWDVDKGYYETGETSLSEGLVGHWDGDGDAIDSSGNSNDGTLQGDATADGEGIFNSSFVLDGNGDYVQTTLTSNTNYSVSMWFKGDEIGNTDSLFAPSSAYGVYIYSSKISWYYTGANSLNSVNTFLPNTWYHLVITAVDNGDKTIYINGQYDASGNGAVTPTAFVNPKIGGGWGYFNGSIDDVMLFNRSLSAEEVSELYVKGIANYSYTDYQELESGVNEVFTIDDTTTNILPDFKLNAGTDNFYTPVLYGDVNLTTWNGATGDNPPTWSNNAVNTTIAGTSANFSIDINDDNALQPNGIYVFSTNNTGTWVNETGVNFTATPETIWDILDLNDTVGIDVSYRWWLNDSLGNNDVTEIFNLTITPRATIKIEPIYPTGNINVTQNEFFNVTLNVTCLTGECGTVNVSLDPETVDAHGISPNGNYDSTSIMGMKIIAKENRTLTKVTRWNGVTYTTAELRDSSLNILASSEFSGNDAVFNYNIIEGTTYYIITSTTSSSTYYLYLGSNPYPIEGTYINWTKGYLGGDFNYAYNIESITTTETATASSKTGLIPIEADWTTEPFYTNATYNPIETGSLSEGQSELVTFYVNATGDVDVVHDFFAFANTTSNLSISNITDHWNVTIVSATPTNCNPTLDTNWIITDTQVCDGVSRNIGTGNITISGSGFLVLKNQANITSNLLYATGSGGKIFIDNSGGYLWLKHP